jgi:transposase InsO family protein
VLALPNQRWSLDFVHDQLVTGRRFQVLNIVDDVTRECLAAVPDTSISGKRVVRELTKLIAQHGHASFVIGPLKPGKYAFMGELHSKTAVGEVVVTDPAR